MERTSLFVGQVGLPIDWAGRGDGSTSSSKSDWNGRLSGDVTMTSLNLSLVCGVGSSPMCCG